MFTIKFYQKKFMSIKLENQSFGSPINSSFRSKILPARCIFPAIRMHPGTFHFPAHIEVESNKWEKFSKTSIKVIETRLQGSAFGEMKSFCCCFKLETGGWYETRKRSETFPSCLQFQKESPAAILQFSWAYSTYSSLVSFYTRGSRAN